jgi:hypothetical protein
MSWRKSRIAMPAAEHVAGHRPQRSAVTKARR